MKTFTFKELVNGTFVRLLEFRKGKLCYDIVDKENQPVGFMFHVPVEDTGDATFNSRDKAIYFSRWIRKALEERKQ